MIVLNANCTTANILCEVGPVYVAGGRKMQWTIGVPSFVAGSFVNTPSLALGTFNVMQMTAGIFFHALKSSKARP